MHQAQPLGLLIQSMVIENAELMLLACCSLHLRHIRGILNIERQLPIDSLVKHGFCGAQPCTVVGGTAMAGHM